MRYVFLYVLHYVIDSGFFIFAVICYYRQFFCVYCVWFLLKLKTCLSTLEMCFIKFIDYLRVMPRLAYNSVVSNN
jgi:hypothetical protein